MNFICSFFTKSETTYVVKEYNAWTKEYETVFVDKYSYRAADFVWNLIKPYNETIPTMKILEVTKEKGCYGFGPVINKRKRIFWGPNKK